MCDEPTGADDQRAILVADDDDVLLSLMEIWLRRAGYRVVVARDGAEAFEQLQTGRQWHAVILDVQMPRLCGTDVLRRLRASGDPTPVLIVSGSPPPLDDLIDPCCFLRKPFDSRLLLTTLVQMTDDAYGARLAR